MNNKIDTDLKKSITEAKNLINKINLFDKEINQIISLFSKT